MVQFLIDTNITTFDFLSPTFYPTFSPTLKPSLYPTQSPMESGVASTAKADDTSLEKNCPAKKCLSRCTDKYKGDRSSGETYFCSEGCVGMGGLKSNGQIEDSTKFCAVDEEERFDYCMYNCETLSRQNSKVNACKYGCGFWDTGDASPTA